MEEQNNKKITDKAFTRFVATSVIAILMCIACLCSSTYAWFNVSQDSQRNTIKTGSFDHEVEVEIVGAGGEVLLTPTADGKGISCALERGKSYTVTLTPADTTTVKGYCVVTVDGAAYNTAFYGAVSEGALESLSFTLTLPDGTDDAEVIFKPHWGIAANEHVANGDILIPGATMN